MKFKILILTVLLTASFQMAFSQQLKLKARKPRAIGGREFANSLNDSTLTLEKREQLIFSEIEKGNVPNFLRKLKPINTRVAISDGVYAETTYYVTPDYLAIGSNEDFFYVPMTPILAQRIANLTETTLPTKKMVDSIYQQASIKLAPQPIPPSKAMTTLPAFIAHNDSVKTQLTAFQFRHAAGELTAGNKKDLIISSKIYTEKTAKVVIYGWHKLDGKAIQPIYNKHTNLWADYSHGVRLVQNNIKINLVTTTAGKAAKNKRKLTIAFVLKDKELSTILSDEGLIEKAFYPITDYTVLNH